VSGGRWLLGIEAISLSSFKRGYIKDWIGFLVTFAGTNHATFVLFPYFNDSGPRTWNPRFVLVNPHDFRSAAGTRIHFPDPC